MKKWIALFLILLFCCSACSAPAETNSPSVDEVDYTTVNIGEKIKGDTAQIVINKSVVTTVAELPELGVTLEANDDKIYFIILGSVTNYNTTAFNFKSNLATELIFDDKYEYAVTIAPSELSNIDPLETQQFVIYASVPCEVINVCEGYKFRFGYNDDFSFCLLDESQNRYELAGEVDQYGAAENVTNFVTFAEYISNEVGKREGLKYSVHSTLNTVIVTDGYVRQFKTLEDGKSEFSIQPTIKFRYSDLLKEKRCIPTLTINFSTVDFPENMYYIYGNTIEISSSNGSIKMDEDSGHRTLVDTFKDIHLLETDFLFEEAFDYDLGEIKEIVNGDDLKITVMVGTLSDDVEVVFECNQDIVNALNRLFELNDSLVKRYDEV